MPRVSVHDMWMIGACPTCGADPGAECLSKLGNRTKGYIHKSRYDPHSGLNTLSTVRIVPLLRQGPRLDVAFANYPLARLFGWSDESADKSPPLRESLNGRKFPGKKLRQGKYKGRAQPTGSGAWLATKPLTIEES